MIKDINNSRYVYFGHGTVTLNPCQDGTSYVILESDYGLVDGTYKPAEYANTEAKDVPKKSVAFVFDGEKAIKSIDMLIEDLQIIRGNLEEQNTFEKDINVPSKQKIMYDYNAKDCEQCNPDSVCCYCKNIACYKLEEQLKAKEQECEELTTINARLLGRLEVDETDTSLVFNLDKELRQKEKEFYTAIQKVVKFKQTLTEIKEIVEQGVKIHDDIIVSKQILQKISEVEDG